LQRVPNTRFLFRADFAACDATSKRCFPLLQTL
jgi:hypothetical protein